MTAPLKVHLIVGQGWRPKRPFYVAVCTEVVPVDRAARDPFDVTCRRCKATQAFDKAEWRAILAFDQEQRSGR